MRRISFAAASFAVLALPAVVSATGLLDTLGLANRIINGLIGLAVLLAILGLFFGLVKYFFKKGDEAKHEGISMMVYGIIAIFVMVSIWGIIRLLQNTFGVGGGGPIIPPGFDLF
ncbi:MAG TPA: hypothetical protein VJB97_01295 [Candidatus Paceibacterota bacterium]